MRQGGNLNGKFILKDNEDTTYRNLQDAAKATHKGNFIALSAQILKKKRKIENQ